MVVVVTVGAVAVVATVVVVVSCSAALAEMLRVSIIGYSSGSVGPLWCSM